MFLDIHTHKTGQHPVGVFQLSNVIVSKDDIPETPCSAGIHPWYIDDNPKEQIKVLSSYAQKQQVLAIGECGLDKLHGAKLDQQIELFERQIDLANTINKPLIIHCVRAHQEVLEILKRKNVRVPVIFHAYTKGNTLAKQIIQKGYYLSLGQSIRKGHQDEVIQCVPLDRIFFETDDNPILIADIYTYFCRVRNLELTTLKQSVVQNFNSIFNTDYLR